MQQIELIHQIRISSGDMIDDGGNEINNVTSLTINEQTYVLTESTLLSLAKGLAAVQEFVTPDEVFGVIESEVEEGHSVN